MEILLYLVRESWLVSAAWRGLVFLSVLYVISPLFRRYAPILSPVIVLTALTGVLLFPLLSVVLPAWELPLFPVSAISSAGQESVSGSGEGAVTDVERRLVIMTVGSPAQGRTLPMMVRGVFPPAPEAAADVAPRATMASGAGPSVVRGLLIIWLLGAVAVLVTILRGMLAAWRLSKRAEQVRDERWLTLTERCRRRLGVHRLISVRMTDELSMPMIWGFRRPVLFVPRSMVGVDEAKMTMILYHELAHVRRGDQLTRLLGRLSCAVNWFNPFVWRFYDILLSEQERACDFLVLACGIRKSDYAAQLLAMARLLPRHCPLRTAAMGMARPGTLECRVKSILVQQLHSKEHNMTIKSLSFLIICGIVAALASLQPFVTEPLQAESGEEKQEAVVVTDQDNDTVDASGKVMKVVVKKGDDDSDPIIISGDSHEKVLVIKKRMLDDKALDQAMESLEQAMKQLDAANIDREAMKSTLEQARQSLEQSRESLDAIPEMLSDISDIESLDEIFTAETLAEIRTEMKKAGKSEEEIERVMSKLEKLDISMGTEPDGDGNKKTIVIKKKKSDE